VSGSGACPAQPGADHLVYPAGLSVREVQVLRLVAGGISNRRIAKELALSENTVANHLTSIFNKTGADNRASATAFAVRHKPSITDNNLRSIVSSCYPS
jgi:DNA-binding NarL/FixJ family response regulator